MAFWHKKSVIFNTFNVLILNGLIYKIYAEQLLLEYKKNDAGKIAVYSKFKLIMQLFQYFMSTIFDLKWSSKTTGQI